MATIVTQNTMALSVLALIGAFLLLKGTTIFQAAGLDGDLFRGLEKQINAPLAMSTVVLCQALFGPQGFTDPPQRLLSLFRNKYGWIVRLVALTAMAYGATQQVEVAASTVIIFLVVMQLLRTPEERKKHPWLI